MPATDNCTYQQLCCLWLSVQSIATQLSQKLRLQHWSLLTADHFRTACDLCLLNLNLFRLCIINSSSSSSNDNDNMNNNNNNQRQTTRGQYTDTVFAPVIWPWPDDLDVRIWPEHCEDVPAYQKWTFRSEFQTLEHYRQTDRQMQLNTLPRRIRGR